VDQSYDKVRYLMVRGLRGAIINFLLWLAVILSLVPQYWPTAEIYSRYLALACAVIAVCSYLFLDVALSEETVQKKAVLPADVTTNDALTLNKLYLIRWYAEMSPKEKSTFWTCWGGWALDAMDVTMLTFAIPAIKESLGINNNADAGLISTATLLTSAFGGWFAGALSDRFGRVRTLQFTIAWFAIFACLSGFAPGFWWLFACRALMGIGFGGEWAAATVLVGEVIRPADRGKAVGAMQSGWAVGWGVAALAATLLLTTLPADLTAADPEFPSKAGGGASATVALTQSGVGLAQLYQAVWPGAPAAWRLLFFLGLVPAMLVFFVRRFVDEPAVFVDTKKNLASAGRKANLLEIFSPPMARRTILTWLLATGAHGGYWAIMTWLPTFLRTERHLTVLGTGKYFFFVIVGSLVGYLVSAWLSDRIGRRVNFILFGAFSIVTVFAYTEIQVNDSTMLVLGFPLGFFASGVFSGIGPFFTELFPTRMRGSGQGFAYNSGRGVAALTPWLVGLVSATSLPLGQSIGVFALAAYSLMILAVLLLPETRGRELTAEAVGFVT
jgi:MFS family permease